VSKWVSEWVSRGLTSHSTHYRSFWGHSYRPDNQTNNVKAIKATSWDQTSIPPGTANCGHSVWCWGGAWQSADHVGTSPRCMSVNVQLSFQLCLVIRALLVEARKTHTQLTSCSVHVRSCHTESRHLFLQGSTTAPLGSTFLSCPKCCHAPRYWHTPVWAYHASIEKTPLAASAAAHGIELTLLEFCQLLKMYLFS